MSNWWSLSTYNMLINLILKVCFESVMINFIERHILIRSAFSQSIFCRYFVTFGLGIAKSKASIQNIGCIAVTELGWYHLNITIGVEILLLRYWGKQERAKTTWNSLNYLVSNGRSKKKKGMSEVTVGDSMIQNPAELLSVFIPISAQLVQYWTQKYGIIINHHYPPTLGRVVLRH